MSDADTACSIDGRRHWCCAVTLFCTPVVRSSMLARHADHRGIWVRDAGRHAARHGLRDVGPQVAPDRSLGGGELFCGRRPRGSVPLRLVLRRRHECCRARPRIQTAQLVASTQ